jgi:hypothetical protein
MCYSSQSLLLKYLLQWQRNEGKAIPVTGHGRPYGCKRSRLPNFLDNQLTDGGKFVSLTSRQLCTPQKYSWYSFPLETESTPGP